MPLNCLEENGSLSRNITVPSRSFVHNRQTPGLARFSDVIMFP